MATEAAGAGHTRPLFRAWAPRRDHGAASNGYRRASMRGARGMDQGSGQVAAGIPRAALAPTPRLPLLRLEFCIFGAG